jgi:hypothetical protein
MKRLDTSRLARPRLCVQSLTPAYGDNYKAGFIGFTYTGSTLLSNGVAYFTRWSRLSDILVSQVLIVTGENECVEMPDGKSVVKSPLDKYFNDPKTQIFFRRPRKCSQALGQRIAETALAQVGTKFETLLTAARVLEGSFLRRWVMSHFQESPDRFVGRLLHREARWFGGELAAYCLDCQPEFVDKGLLKTPCHGIDPQQLFEDEEIFANWHAEPEEGPKSPAAHGG